MGQLAKPAVPPQGTEARAALAKARTTEDLGKLLAPISIAGGLALKPESFLGKKALTFLTGFKVTEVGEMGNKMTPGVGMFLAPEPLGLLPERFFQRKPRVPGTNIFLDPMYNLKRYEDRKASERREDVGSVQIKLLGELVPTLTDEQLYELRSNKELQRKHITYADPFAVDAILQKEVQQRQAVARLNTGDGPIAIADGNREFAEHLVGTAVGGFLSGDPQLLAALPGYLTPDLLAAARGEQPVRFVDGKPIAPDENQEIAHATEVDRMFAANPPDP